MRVYRATISNIDYQIVVDVIEGWHRHIKGATFTRGHGFYWEDGSIVLEENLTIEIASASLDPVKDLIVDLLQRGCEQCAYFTVDSAIPKLLYSDGIFRNIEASEKQYAAIHKSNESEHHA